MASSTLVLLVLVASLIGVVAIGVVAFTRSAKRSDVRHTSVDDPGLDLDNCPANRLLQLPPSAFEEAARRLQETLADEMEIFI